MRLVPVLWHEMSLKNTSPKYIGPQNVRQQQLQGHVPSPGEHTPHPAALLTFLPGFQLSELKNSYVSACVCVCVCMCVCFKYKAVAQTATTDTVRTFESQTPVQKCVCIRKILQPARFSVGFFCYNVNAQLAHTFTLHCMLLMWSSPQKFQNFRLNASFQTSSQYHVMLQNSNISHSIN